MRTICALSFVVVVLAASAALGAPEPGKATGKLVVSGKTVKLTTAYAVEKRGGLRVYLADRALTEDELFDDDALSEAAGSKSVSAIVVRMSADRKAEEAYYFHSGLPAGLSVTELTRFTPKETGGDRIAGRMVFDDKGFSWSFDAAFDAPVLLELRNELPLPANASKADVAKRELSKREVKFTPQAFSSAVIDENADLVKLFLEAGMPPDTDDALSAAINVKSPAVVKALVEAGADLNALGPYRQSHLLSAASMGNAEVVTILLGAGADPNVPNEYGIAPLSAAAEQGHLDIVQALIVGGANVNAREKPYGGSAMQVAVLRGHKEIVKALLDAGTDVRKDKAALLELTKDPEIRAMIEAAARKK